MANATRIAGGFAARTLKVGVRMKVEATVYAAYPTIYTAAHES